MGKSIPTPRVMSSQSALYGESTEAIRSAFDQVVSRLRCKVVMPGFKKLKRYQLLSALVLWFVNLGEEDQDRAAAEFVELLKLRLSGDDVPVSRPPQTEDQ